MHLTLMISMKNQSMHCMTGGEVPTGCERPSTAAAVGALLFLFSSLTVRRLLRRREPAEGG